MSFLNWDIAAIPDGQLTIRSASLTGYPELARSLGLDPVLLMRQVGLPVRCMDNLETRISVNAVHQLLEISACDSGVEDFGLRLASKRRLSNLGPLSLVLREEPTGMHALETMCRYLRLINTSLFTRIERRADLIVIKEVILVERAQSARQAIEMAIGVLVRAMRDLMGAQWRPRRVCFTHRPPDILDIHFGLFGPNVEFNADFNGIVCSALELNQQLPRTDFDMAQYAHSFFERAVAQPQNGEVTAIRQLMSMLLPGRRCTAEHVAQHLGVDRRTVHRRLREEGENFSSVLRMVRRDLVQRQLSDADKSNAEVADLLGFSGPSSLANWFRGEFGCTVSEWRRASKMSKHSAHGFSCAG